MAAVKEALPDPTAGGPFGKIELYTGKYYAVCAIGGKSQNPTHQATDMLTNRYAGMRNDTYFGDAA